MSFSFIDGTPIAYIKSDNFPHKILYLTENDDEESTSKVKNIWDYLGDEFVEDNKLTINDVNKLKKALNSGYKLQDGELKNIYKKIKKELKEKTKNEFNLLDGELIPIPDYKMRDNFYISASSGAGKSVLASKIARQWMKEYPNRPIYVFTSPQIGDDEAFDKLGDVMTRVPIDESWFETPPELKDIEENSLCIFDDIDTIQPKALNDLVKILQDQVLQIGRHRNIYCISMTHKMCANKKTSIIIEEARKIIFFPRGGGSKMGITRVLKEYVGVDTKAIKKMWCLPSRWVMISKGYPMYAMHEKGCFLIK